MKSFGLLFGLLALLVMLPSCDKDDEDPFDLDPGSFTLIISGDYEASFDGSAIFNEVTDPDTGDKGFAIYLVSHGGDNSSLVMAAGGGRPGQGTYDIVRLDDEDLDDPEEIVIDPGKFVAWFREDPAAAMKLFLSESGSVTIYESATTGITGGFEFAAKGIDTSDPETVLNVVISGEFFAMGGGFDQF